MSNDDGAPFTIDILTVQELKEKGTLKLMDYGGINNYIAIFEHKYYALVKEPDRTYYELIQK